MYGVSIAACLAKPRPSIVLDNKAATRCVSKPPSLQSSNYALHDTAYQFISSKSLQVRCARGHRDPEKVHSLKDHQDRFSNELADCVARTSSCMCPCYGPRSTSPANILLNNHVMPSSARKWIVKAPPQKLVPEAHWTSWLPLRIVNRDKWGPSLCGKIRWPGCNHPGKRSQHDALDAGSTMAR